MDEDIRVHDLPRVGPVDDRHFPKWEPRKGRRGPFGDEFLSFLQKTFPVEEFRLGHIHCSEGVDHGDLGLLGPLLPEGFLDQRDRTFGIQLGEPKGGLGSFSRGPGAELLNDLNLDPGDSFEASSCRSGYLGRGSESELPEDGSEEFRRFRKYSQEPQRTDPEGGIHPPPAGLLFS